MFTNYLKVVLRNIRNQKAYAFINIAGFAVGIATCMLIILYVLNELSYDKFHDHADRIYRVGVEGNLSGSFVRYPLSNLGTGPTLTKDYPEVESFTRIYPIDKTSVKYNNHIFYEERLIYVDRHFFTVFSFPLIQGDYKTALVNPYSIVITQQMAKKYFGDEDPVGKQIRLDNKDDYRVTGVLENTSQNSHLKFDFLCSMETYYAKNPKADEWTNFNNYTYLLLAPNVEVDKFTQKFPAFIDSHLSMLRKLLGGDLNFFLQPVTDIHLRSNLGYEMPGNGDITYVYVFSSIAIFILIIACINFMNLATARSANRAKEVGLRKVFGADKSRLVKQFLAESMFYCLTALIIAIVLVKLTLPFFNTLYGNTLRLPLNEMFWLIPVFVGFTLLTGLLAGSYPAFFLSAFQPVAVMRGALKAGSTNSMLRKVLVILQFVISITLITGTIIMLNQLKFMKSKKLGFDKEHVVIIPIPESGIRDKLDAVKNSLRAHTSVISVSSASDVPGEYPDYSVFVPEGYTLEQTQLMHRINCDDNFIQTMGMEIIAGRKFSKEFATDYKDATIINETAAKKYGWENPIGKQIGFFSDNEMTKTEPKTVIGVVRDFHVKSLHDKILPLLLTNNKDYHEEIIVRIKPQNIPAILAFLEETWRQYEPDRLFDYRFLDVKFDAQYKADEQTNKIIGYFSIFAILVACLGLYGMASFMTEQRFKEIGIRKTLGASVPNIVALLSLEVTKLIIIANVIAIPIAYYVLDRWLENFAYRIGISFYTFAISAVIVLVISYVTIAYQSVKAAFTNPIDVIRVE